MHQINQVPLYRPFGHLWVLSSAWSLLGSRTSQSGKPSESYPWFTRLIQILLSPWRLLHSFCPGVSCLSFELQQCFDYGENIYHVYIICKIFLQCFPKCPVFPFRLQALGSQELILIHLSTALLFLLAKFALTELINRNISGYSEGGKCRKCRKSAYRCYFSWRNGQQTHRRESSLGIWIW